MKNRFAMTMLALALVATGVVYALATDARMNRGAATAVNLSLADEGPLARPIVRRIFSRVATELNLSDAQQTEIKALIKDEFTGAKPLLEKLHENRRQLQAISGDGQFDEARVRAAASEQGQIVTELIVAKERAKAKVLSVLTTEQRARAAELLERLAARRARFLGAH
jgi:Spy/CpxP family protein refolding chaperone